MNVLVTVASMLDRLPDLFPAENLRREMIAVVNDKLLPLRGLLKHIVEDADANRDINRQIKGMIKVCCELEDLIESYALEVASRRNGFINRIFKRSNQQIFKVMMKKLDELLIHLPKQYTPSEQHNLGIVHHELSREFSRSESVVIMDKHDEETGPMVDEEEALRDALTLGIKELGFVSICGMGGIGKTILARKLFESIIVKTFFHTRVWITVSPQYKTRNILQQILSHDLGYGKKTTETMTEEDLGEYVYRSLKGRRYLMVFDDVWDAEVWFSFRMFFPDDHNGSRVLITTRNRHVAEELGPKNSYIHSMRPLTDEESWHLLRHHTRLNGSQVNPEIEEIGMKIAKLCEGLPLAIVTVSRILRDRALDVWKNVLNQLEMSNSSVQHQTLDIISLSYKHLPPYLRPCILCLSNSFPEDAEIEMDTACQLLIAENLVSMENLRDGVTMMDVAEEYLYALADSSLVILSNEDSRERRLMSCRIHDLIRKSCINKGKEEEFCEVVDENSPMSSAIRRVIFLDKKEYTHFHLYGNADYLRTLVLFSTTPCEQGYIIPREIPNLEKFIWLRVLNIYGVDFIQGKLPKGIEKLVYLRYLSLRECYLVELSSSLGNMVYLQTLDLRIRNEFQLIVAAASVLDNLERLKHLYLPMAYKVNNNDAKLGLGRLKKLEILHNFDPNMCDADELFGLINLRELTVINFDCYSTKRLKIMEKMFSCNITTLGALRIEGHLRKLPDIDWSCSSKLTEIVLNGSELDKDPMQILQKLPKLRLLVLEMDAYAGKIINCSSYGFPQLSCLKLSNLSKLEDWEIEEEAMPALTTLIIDSCKNLKSYPEGLYLVYGLRKLKITSMPQAFVDSIDRDMFMSDVNIIAESLVQEEMIMHHHQGAGNQREDPQSSSML